MQEETFISRYFKQLLVIFALVVLIIMAVILSLAIGEIKIRPSELFYILSNKDSLEYSIIMKLRFPRIVLAFSVGGALGLSGAILQGIYRNPLVEPYTLGISGGAAFGVALAIVLGIHSFIGAATLPLFGFLGAVSTIFLVYLLGLKKGTININRMLLIGVMISFVASSLMMLLMSVTTSENIHSIVFWTMGSLDESDSKLILLMLFSSITGLIISYFFARPLNVLRLGQVNAMHMGINTILTVRVLFITASLLTGVCVAVAGIIGFVGLLIPHLIRLISGSDYRFFLISSFLGGGIFLIFSDTIARTIISPNELPIGVITGIAGGIAFIFILSNSKQFKV